MPKINSLLILVVGMLSLSGCSSTNVSGEWDCPRQMGHGCITIDEADQIAVEKLNSRYKASSTSEDAEKNKIIQKEEYKVWLAPRVDIIGHKHEASTVYYYEEVGESQDVSLEPIASLKPEELN